MRIALFGGRGYLGRHLAQELLNWGHTVGCTPEEYGDRFDILVHLACPRNKPSTWDWRRAEQALDEGLILGRRARVVLISSMSVYDQPDNGYAQFKRMAERVVLERRGMVLRLPTLLGTTDDVLRYRMDLGLHQIAYAMANGGAPTVNRHAVRHVAPVWYVAEQIAGHIAANGGGIHELSVGTARFMDIVPRSVPFVTEPPGTGSGYVPVSWSMQPMMLVRLQQAFTHLVERIKDGSASSI